MSVKPIFANRGSSSFGMGEANSTNSKPCSPIGFSTNSVMDRQRPSDSALVVTRLLPETIGKPHSEYTRFVHRLTQIEVVLVGIDHRILIREVGDIELRQPLGIDLIKTNAEVHDRIAWLQYARQSVGAARLQVVPHISLVSDVVLNVPMQSVADCLLIPDVTA